MGLKCASYFFQQVMEQVLQRFDNVKEYLDNIGIFPKLGKKTSS